MIRLSHIFTIALSVVVASAFLSCKEQDEVLEYDNWKARNDHYIDSIYTVARTNADGSWTMYKAYNVGDSLGFNGKSDYYIYVQKLDNGTGTDKPYFNDSVRIHYQGRLIPSASYPSGYVFGKSYSTHVPNEATDVPALVGVNNTVPGFATALMNMVVGDHWRLIIPWYLGYGSSSSVSAVPDYSTLIFDVKLAKIYRFQKDTDTAWW